jgi:hypothetical protein
MARILQIQFSHAYYHVTCRGNDRRSIYRDDSDQEPHPDHGQESSDQWHLCAFSQDRAQRVLSSRSLDAWLRLYNEDRPHQGQWCYGKTPLQTFIDSIPLAKEKMIAA